MISNVCYINRLYNYTYIHKDIYTLRLYIHIFFKYYTPLNSDFWVTPMSAGKKRAGLRHCHLLAVTRILSNW